MGEETKFMPSQSLTGILGVITNEFGNEFSLMTTGFAEELAEVNSESGIIYIENGFNFTDTARELFNLRGYKFEEIVYQELAKEFFEWAKEHTTNNPNGIDYRINGLDLFLINRRDSAFYLQ